MGSLFLFRMVPTILLVISTALAGPRGNMTTEDYMEGSEDNSGNSDYSEGSHDFLEGAHDYMVGPEDYSGNYTDYLEGAILERSDSLLEDRAINTCGCAPVSSSNRIVGGKEVNPKGKLPYQVYFNPLQVQFGRHVQVRYVRRHDRQQDVRHHCCALLQLHVQRLEGDRGRAQLVRRRQRGRQGDQGEEDHPPP